MNSVNTDTVVAESEQQMAGSSDERLGLPSASRLWLVSRCPASWRLQEASPRVETDAMRDGTAMHAAIEARTKGEPIPQPPIPEHWPPSEVAERLAGWNSMVEAACKAMACVAADAGMAVNDPDVDVVVERRLMIKFNDRVIGTAKADCILYHRARKDLLVVDYKTAQQRGYSMLDSIKETAAESAQMWACVTAYVDSCLNSRMWRVKRARLAYIKVPLFDFSAPVECEDSGWIGHQKIWSKIIGTRALLLAATDDRAPVVPGSHCKWCQAKNVCIARLQGLLLGGFGEDTSSMLQKNPKLASIIVHYKSDIEAMIEGAKKVLASLSDKELEELGWRKGVPVKRSIISDVPSAFDTLRDRGIAENVMLRCCTMSYNTLVKEIAGVFSMSDGEARDYLAEAIGACISAHESEPRLLRLKGAPAPQLMDVAQQPNSD